MNPEKSKRLEQIEKTVKEIALNYLNQKKDILTGLISDGDSKDFHKYSVRLYLCATEKLHKASPMRYRVIPVSGLESGFISIDKNDLLEIIKKADV